MSLDKFKEFDAEHIDDVCEAIDLYEDLEITEAEYQGRKVKLNDPMRSNDGKRKFYPNMEIKRDDPARRKSFRARHRCDNPGPKYKARYWSCYQWRAGSKVDN